MSSNIGYVSQDSIVLNKTSAVEEKLDEANDCSFFDKFVYYGQKYTQPLPNQGYRRGYRTPYGYKQPVVVCDPTKYTNVGALWAVDPHQNIEEAMHSQQTRANAQGFQFNQNGVAVISLNSGHQDSCFVLTNAKGTLIPVRSGSDPYMFSNPLLAVKNAHLSKQNTINTAKSGLLQAKNRIIRTHAHLNNNRAWDGAQCAVPQQKPLPRKPETVSMEEAQFQANGYCSELSARRRNPLHVVEALGAIFEDQIISDWQKWRNLKPEQKQSCAVVKRSQTEDWLMKGCGWFGDNADRSCTQDMIKKCVRQSINQCTGALRRWQNTVAKIRQEPRQTYQACLQSKQSVQQAQTSIPTLETDLRQAHAISLPQDNRSKVSLAEAVCNRGQHQKTVGL